MKQLTNRFETKHGRKIAARPLTIYDAPFLVDIFEHMSAESRYRRFHQTLDNPKQSEIWAEAEKIAQMDEDEQGGLIAFWVRPLRPNTPVGAARYVYLDEQTAEIAMSVRDDMQGEGIGTWLLCVTMEQAARDGLTTLVGMALNNNEGIWRLLNKMPYPFTRTTDGGVSEIEIDLTAVASEINVTLNPKSAAMRVEAETQ